MNPTFPPVATRALEQVLCNPAPLGNLEAIYPRNDDCWQRSFPSLATLLPREGAQRPLEFCIATEDIVGPVRNGGIGTTYAAVALGLAARGHKVTVLYLRGESVENETAQHWVEHYGAQGVRFVPVPDYAQKEGLKSRDQRWFASMYNMYRWLVENPMDVVHVSEWRGSGYLSLLAKRQGLGLEKTLFLVKTSSPWLWNRLYESKPIDRREELLKTYAERRSVELADMVIGGSAHLLQWMSSQGYVLPAERTFVQPNFVRFDHLRDLISRRALTPGTRVAIDEIVFFGRLESRKGLVTFCQAINRLVKLGHDLPPRVSFMGKPGARLDVRQRQGSLEFIAAESKDWPTEVQIHPNFQQYEALDYLLSGNRLAVMPSTIENSSLAVYEAAICGIPFIASATGGTPELVDPSAHDKVLCDPHPVPLARLIAEAIDSGAFVAPGSFDNDANVETWDRFHDALGCGLQQELLERAELARPLGTSPAGVADVPVSIDVLIYSRANARRLEETARSLLAQIALPNAVRIAVDAIPAEVDLGDVGEALAARGILVEIVDTSDFDQGLAHNTLAARSDADYLLFLDEGALLEANALKCLGSVAARRDADLLTFFHRWLDGEGKHLGSTNTELIGSPALAFSTPEAASMPLLVKRATFVAVGGFTVDFRVPMHERELMVKTLLSAGRCETIPQVLGSIPETTSEWLDEQCYNIAASEFRAMRPFLAAAPLAVREMLLHAKSRVAGGIAEQDGRRASNAASDRSARRAALQTAAAAVADNSVQQALIVRLARTAARNVRRAETLAKWKGEKIEGLSTDAEQVIALTSRLTGSSNQTDIDTLLSTLGTQEMSFRAKTMELLDDGFEGPVPTVGSLRLGGCTQSALTWRILDVRSDRITGWIVDQSPAKRRATVEVRAADRVLARSKPLATIDGMRLDPGVASGLFQIELPHLHSVGAAIELVASDDETLIGGLNPPLPRVSNPDKSPYLGFAEKSSFGEVRGWVFRPGHERAAVTVAIYIDGRYYGRLVAEQMRGDVKEAGHGTGLYGFTHLLPDQLLRNGAHSIELVVAGENIMLQGAPMVMRGAEVRSASERGRGMFAWPRGIRELLRRAGVVL